MTAVTYNVMVVDKLAPDEVDRLFHALADRTRRDIVVRVIERESSVSELARGYEDLWRGRVARMDALLAPPPTTEE